MNDDLFTDTVRIRDFDTAMRQALLDAGQFDWTGDLAERVFRPSFVDAQRHYDTVPADMDPIDQPHRPVQRVERGRAPRVQLRLGLRHKASTDRIITSPLVSHDILSSSPHTSPVLTARELCGSLLSG